MSRRRRNGGYEGRQKERPEGWGVGGRQESDRVFVTTPSGFSCEIRKDALDDWGFARAAAEAAKNPESSLSLAVYMADMLLTKGDEARLEAHVSNGGRVKASAMMSEMQAILESLGDAAKK